jgi:NADPH2:quinone reductase
MRAVKIAKHLGVRRVIGALRTEHDRAHTAGIPADQWLALDQHPLPQGLLELTDGRGADLILDGVAGPLFEPLNQCLNLWGRHVVIASLTPTVSFNLIDFYHRQAKLIGLDTVKFTFEESAGVLREILPLVKQGVLTPPKLSTLSLNDAPAAYRALNEGTATDKKVIRF